MSSARWRRVKSSYRRFHHWNILPYRHACVVVRTAQANPSTAQTNTALIPLTTGRHVKVSRVYVSSDTALTVSLVNSVTHDLLWRQYVGATGGSSAEYDFTSAISEGLDYSTSATGNVFLQVGYEYSGS